MMRYSPAEKLEIIQLVEESTLPVKQTLAELDVPRSTFYRWYLQYQDNGPDGLQDQKTGPRQFWNKIPEAVKEHVVEVALGQPDLSPRQLAWQMTDDEEYFISESSVYRILKGFDLIQSPAFKMITAADEFEYKTKRVNELWQTDFTQFKVVGWGWFYLCTVLDDYSRYILSWRLSTTMGASDVEETLQTALDGVGISLHQGQTPAAFALRQRSLLHLQGAQAISAPLSHHPYSLGPLPSDDPGQDRTLSPVDEERCQARYLLFPLGIGTSYCRICRLLQQRALPRVAQQSDAG